jgi:prepilin-type N-terminal cleavage/methylation domain-containing protein
MIPSRIRRISSCLKKTKSKELNGSKNAENNRGFSLVELLIAIAVLAAISAMLLQLLSAAVGFYRKTIFTSQLQKSSQMISRRLDSAIMNASSLYYQTDENGNAFLYMGNSLPGQQETAFQGALIWYDSENDSVYYCEQQTIASSQNGLLTIANVKKALEGESLTNKEYLLGTHVSGLTFMLPSDMGQCRREPSSIDDLSYVTDNQPAVTYELSLRHVSGIMYTISNTAVPRNHLKGIWWPTDAIAAKRN